MNSPFPEKNLPSERQLPPEKRPAPQKRFRFSLKTLLLVLLLAGPLAWWVAGWVRVAANPEAFLKDLGQRGARHFEELRVKELVTKGPIGRLRNRKANPED